MKKIVLIIILLASFYEATACHDATLTQLSAVDNGNNTYTYQLQVCFGTGAGSNTYGFWLNFTGGNLIGYPASVTGPSTGNVKPASVPPVSGTGIIEYGDWDNTGSSLLSGTGNTDCLTLTLTFDAPITSATFGGFQPGLACGATPKTITTTSCFATLASYTVTIKVKNCNNNNVSWSLDGATIVSNITTNGSTYSWIYCGGCKSTFDISASATGGNCPGGVDSWSISSNGTVIASGSNTGATVGPINVSACGTLPIELLSFDAVFNGRNVDMKWSTASEINNDFFTLERSVDGVNFEAITKVKGAGNSSEVLKYESVDASPYFALTYYRLKQTDFDGQFTYSEMVAVSIKNKNENFAVFPNPAGNNAEISFNSQMTDEAVLIIMDLTGRLVLNKKINMEKGMNSIKLDTGEFNNGIYFVTLANKYEVYKTKFIKE